MLHPRQYQLSKATRAPAPWPGTSRSPRGYPGDGEGVGTDPVGLSTGCAAQGARPRVLATRRGQEKPPSPLLSPIQGGQRRQEAATGVVGTGRSAARGQTAAAESRSRVPLKAAHAAHPSGRRGFAPPNRRLKKEGGKKTPARLNFVPFNTRVITTSGNLPPTQLCARINWKSIITITNNSLLAFIASKAWRNSHRRFPHRHVPSDVGSRRVSPCHEGQRREERGP